MQAKHARSRPNPTTSNIPTPNVQGEIDRRFSPDDVSKMKQMMDASRPSRSTKSSTTPKSPWGFETPRPSLWLRGDAGVVTSDSNDRVSEWKDQSFSSHMCVSSTSSQQQKQPSRPGEFHLRHSSRHRNVHKQQQQQQQESSSKDQPHLVLSTNTNIPDSIEFPCTMHCPTVRLNDRTTSFFTIMPQSLDSGVHVEGQRFFGTYPEGQFRFVDGDAAFYAQESGVHKSTTTTTTSIHPGRWNLVTYRFDRFAEISSNGDGLVRVKDRTGRSVRAVFTNDRLGNPGVYVGGVRGDTCGFKGRIGEILHFNALLSNEQVDLVHQYLADRWKMNVGGSSLSSRSSPSSSSSSVILEDRVVKDEKEELVRTTHHHPSGHRHPSRGYRGGNGEEKENDSEKNKIDLVLDWEPPIGSNTAMVIAWRSARDAARLRLDRGDMSDSEVDRELDVLTQIKKGFSSSSSSSSSSSFDDSSSSSQEEEPRENSRRNNKKRNKNKRQKLTGNIINMPAPEDASLETKFEWEEKVNKLKKEIRNMKVGGPKLREWLQKKKRELTIYRSKLFGDV